MKLRPARGVRQQHSEDDGGPVVNFRTAPTLGSHGRETGAEGCETGVRS